jgi:ArsR family transcriptional regulator
MAPTVALSEATVSHHLKQLLLAGLVTKRRDGMNVYYRLVPEAVAAIARTLNPDCC